MTTVHVVTAPWYLKADEIVWGTGGWSSLEEREALDWLTLVRLLGWSATSGSDASVARPDIAIVAHRYDLPIDALRSWADAGTLIVAPHDVEPSLVSTVGEVSGRSIAARVTGGEHVWRLHDRFTAVTFAEEEGWRAAITLDGSPIAVRRDAMVVLGFHPSAARDATGALTDVLVRLLTGCAPTPTAWLDLSGTMVLRMDDPGGAQNVYSRDWSYPKLDARAWAAVGRTLRDRQAILSVAYSAAFVDDGDERRGRLYIEGRPAPRSAGEVFASPTVVYEDVAGHRPGETFDLRSEYEGLRALVRDGGANVEVHGYTHIHPDLSAWAVAADRYEAIDWYRELGPAAQAALDALPPDKHPVRLAVDEIEGWFGRRPRALVCPGEAWTNASLEVALSCGLDIVGSYYLGFRHADHLCWTTHVCAPYLDEAAAHWFASPLPVVGYMHDRDLAINGVGWLADNMDAWAGAGAIRFIDYRALAACLASPVAIEAREDAWRLRIPHDAPVAFRTGTSPPEEVLVSTGNRERTLPVTRDGDVGRVQSVQRAERS